MDVCLMTVESLIATLAGMCVGLVIIALIYFIAGR